MLSREFGTNNVRPTILGNSFFSTDEMGRLESLRQNYYQHAEYLERVIDDRRMEFARWLIEHGKLSEGAPEA